MAKTSEELAIAIRHHQEGRLQAAEQIYRQILAVEPDQADAWHLLGVASAQLGKHQAGTECLRRALALRPDVAEIHSNLGNILKEQGKWDEAVACYRRALQRKPNFPSAHHNLGNVLQDQGKLDEAVVCYRRALAAAPNFAEAHNNLGNALMRQGKLDEAIHCYRRAVQRKPGYVEAHNSLGLACLEQGNLDEAVACFRTVCDLTPGFAEAHNNLGAALFQQGNLDEAAACFRRALQRKPDYAEAHNNLGLACLEQGNLDEAAACFRQVVHLESGGRPSGDNDCRGPEALRPPAVPSSPRREERNNNLVRACGKLAILLQGRLPEDDLRVLRQLSSETDLCDDARAVLHYALAQALDARGDYRAAAGHIHEANAARLAALKRRKREYLPAKHRALIDNTLATFTPQFFARVRGLGLETEQPVFILGLPRSGTTLVEQILASHPRVFGGGELSYCEDTFHALPRITKRNGTPFECAVALDGETLRQLAQQHLDRLRALGGGALRIVDKLPGNYQYLGLIRALFPRAPLIHCRRDLRDVALSCRMTKFASVPWACDPEQLLCHFEAYARVMDHWRKVLPSPPLDVDYEEVVEDTERVARRVIAWCGLDWDPACLRFYETRRPVKTASVAQVRLPIYQSSVGRWKNYEPLLGDLFSRARRIEETWFGQQQPADR